MVTVIELIWKSHEITVVHRVNARYQLLRVTEHHIPTPKVFL